uniref:Uncharacterized protein n=1 Tax=Rhizophora mucronata TaxID=61149 RepID=A0A2P2IHS8_RHIMU
MKHSKVLVSISTKTNMYKEYHHRVIQFDCCLLFLLLSIGLSYPS